MKINSEFTPRLYQEKIFSTSTQKNTLVVLPTGMGKTAIAAMLISQRLQTLHGTKAVFLAPTKPLAQQHYNNFKELISDNTTLALFTGSTAPAKRAEEWKTAQIIFSTPQGMENDLIGRKISLEEVSVIVFDEAHRATGEYAYVYIAQRYHEQARHERILALTASPGSDEESIKELCEKLYIEALEVRSKQDEDVKDYTQELNISWQEVKLTVEQERIRRTLQELYEEKLTEAIGHGVLGGGVQNYNKTTLLKLQAELMGQAARGEKHYELLKTVSLVAEALKTQHALELIETQSIAGLINYLETLQKQSLTSTTKAVKNLVSTEKFKEALILARNCSEEHPKIKALQEIITKELMNTENIIVFTQFRDTAKLIAERLAGIASAKLFVGQAKKNGTGLTQKKQQETLEAFKNKEFQVLIATSVAEEGLDIPAVDVVIFYEPIPSAIRTVQRRGRTARMSEGKCIVLVTKGTRDEGYRWSAHHKEKRMYRNLKTMNKTYVASMPEQEQKTVLDYEQTQTILVDHREKGSAVMKELLKAGRELELKTLTTGDYVVGSAVIEYKTVKDFVDSIIDGRLLGQLRDLRSTHKPLLIIEGQENLYTQRKIAPASIQGMLATIIHSYQIPLLRTMSAAETAGVISAIARREEQTDRVYQAHNHKPWSKKEQQEYVVSSLPGIGLGLAKPMLERFTTIKNIMNATEEELQQVALIGEKKAKTIRNLIDEEY